MIYIIFSIDNRNQISESSYLVNTITFGKCNCAFKQGKFLAWIFLLLILHEEMLFSLKDTDWPKYSWHVSLSYGWQFLAESLDVIQDNDWVTSLGNAFARQYVLYTADDEHAAILHRYKAFQFLIFNAKSYCFYIFLSLAVKHQEGIAFKLSSKL